MQMARTASAPLTSSAIRKTFLDYFCLERGHRLVRSSPVLPFGDPSLAFVNAGMNQFKGVLLGTALPPSGRVANSQKCVRVGGKHNDLSVVGRDGTHHTFFEMLGNWSFADYFKDEACAMSWELLTKVYGLDPTCLHVTYFGGDRDLGLDPDLETRDIWRQIGVPEERLLPGSAQDNFWEMGDSGPCGGCTEIHYQLKGSHHSPLLEIWNLVFIEYKREPNGTLHKLERRHVDTGMGFERLVAVLQGKSANYDTDLFAPLFRAIQSAAGCPEYSGRYGGDDNTGLDTAYRVLADHARMTTVCLADGFFPDQEGKLRGIIRKGLRLSQEVFGKEEILLSDLASVVAETLYDAYPEVAHNLPRVQHIISHEAELLRTLQRETLTQWEALCQAEPQLSILPVGECPNLLPAYKRLKANLGQKSDLGGQLDAAEAWKICETFGVPPHLAADLAAALGLKLDMNALEAEVTKSKLESRQEIYNPDAVAPGELSASTLKELVDNGVPVTDDSSKYLYQQTFGELPTFPDQAASIVALVVDGGLFNYVSPEIMASCAIGVVLDRTNMYPEAGGQACDTGTITVEGGLQLEVLHVSCSGGYVVHQIRCPTPTTEGLHVYNHCIVKIDAERRRSLMNNHTATHLLNGTLRQFLTVTDQKSSRVSPQKLSFDFSVYRESLNIDDLRKIEQTVRNVIRHGVYVRKKVVDSCEMGVLKNLTVLPGEAYPHKTIRVIEIPSGYFLSREPCCGTHAVRTSHLEDFVITNYKSLSSSVKTIQAVTGAQAAEARRNAIIFSDQLTSLAKCVDQVLGGAQKDEAQVEACGASLGRFLSLVRETELLSYIIEEHLTTAGEALRTKLKYSARDSLRTSMDVEMKEVLATNSLPYLVHYLQCSSSLDKVPLQKASQLCPEIPSLIFARNEGVVKARCCVPKQKVSDKFSAQLWLGHVLRELKAEGGPPRGQNPDLVFNMKGKKLSDSQLESALKSARDFVASAT